MRTLEELTAVTDPALPLVRQWFDAATNEVVVLPTTREAGEQALLALQVTTASPMGAIALETGGVLIDGGWVRVLGGNVEPTGNLALWNERDGGMRMPGAFIVGSDAIGGFFAINGGAFAGKRGEVHYFAPDSCTWESLEVGYSDWLSWLCTGDLELFYEGTRWSSWRDDTAGLPQERAWSTYPPLWAQAGPSGRSRRSVPIEELWSLYVGEYARQLRDNA